MIRQRVQDNNGVLTRLDHLVQIANGALTRGAGKGSVLPCHVVVMNKETANEIAECMKTWDRETGMSRAEYEAACKRTLKYFPETPNTPAEK